VPGLAELTQRVAPVGRVVGVAFFTMRRQLSSVVQTTLVSERLKKRQAAL